MVIRCTLVGILVGCTTGILLAQDRSSLADHHVWLPMTGVTAEQMDDAVAAGYTAIMLKVRPALSPDGRSIGSDPHKRTIQRARDRNLKLVLAILGWVGLPNQEFWDTDEEGTKIPGRLDPFWPEAMQHFEKYLAHVIDHYAADPDVVAFAPTWGIYGEAGFTSFAAGRSPHALARFNEWLADRGLPAVEQLPTNHEGPNTDWNRFIRFRYLYMQDAFDAIISRLKPRAGDRPVGTWQELYPAIGYLWTMVRVPSADFALYESCFPFQTNHDPQRTLAETMGFRYRCASAAEFRNYYLPLLARKRGEGQRFMGCQLSNHYAVQNYGWTKEKAERVHFDRWEDEFSSCLRQLMSEPLESPERDVLLVFPTYAAAALTQHPRHSVDAMSIDIMLRQYGCQMMRIGSPRLDELTTDEMNAYRLIVIPASAYILPETWTRLNQATATVLFTGCFGQSFNGEFVAFGESRRIEGRQLRYLVRPAGNVSVSRKHVLTRGLPESLESLPVELPEGESFTFASPSKEVTTLLTCGTEPLLSIARGGRSVFLHGQFFADVCHDLKRTPPDLGGSRDASANEADLWGPYSASHPQQAFALELMGNLLDHAGVAYRVIDPEPRTCAPLLGDHMEPAGISANIVYNNMDQPRTLTLRLPYAPAGLPHQRDRQTFIVRVQVSPFSYRAIQPAKP